MLKLWSSTTKQIIGVLAWTVDPMKALVPKRRETDGDGEWNGL